MHKSITIVVSAYIKSITSLANAVKKTELSVNNQFATPMMELQLVSRTPKIISAWHWWQVGTFWWS